MAKISYTGKLQRKRTALCSLGYEQIKQELIDILEACGDIHWYIEKDDDTLLNALDDNEEEVWEFRMAFIDLEGKAERLLDELQGWNVAKNYNGCTVALLGNRYTVLGWDGVEEDYIDLCGYDKDLAQTEAGKRFYRNSKSEMISIMGQCLGIIVAFLDLREQYDRLKVTFDVLRDENTSLLAQIKECEKAYIAAEAIGFADEAPETKRFDMLINNLPAQMWISWHHHG